MDGATTYEAAPSEGNHDSERDMASGSDSGASGEFTTVTHRKRKPRGNRGRGRGRNMDGRSGSGSPIPNRGSDHGDAHRGRNRSESFEAERPADDSHESSYHHHHHASTSKTSRRIVRPPHESRLRTKPCKWFFYTETGCTRGDACWFSHDKAVFDECQRLAREIVGEDPTATVTLDAAKESDVQTGSANPPPAAAWGGPTARSFCEVVAASAAPTAAATAAVDINAAHGDVSVPAEVYEDGYVCVFDSMDALAEHLRKSHAAHGDGMPLMDGGFVYKVSPHCIIKLSFLWPNDMPTMDRTMHSCENFLRIDDICISATPFDGSDGIAEAGADGVSEAGAENTFDTESHLNAAWTCIDTMCATLSAMVVFDVGSIAEALSHMNRYGFLFTYPNLPCTLVSKHYFHWEQYIHALWYMCQSEIDILRKTLSLRDHEFEAMKLRAALSTATAIHGRGGHRGIHH